MSQQATYRGDNLHGAEKRLTSVMPSAMAYDVVGVLRLHPATTELSGLNDTRACSVAQPGDALKMSLRSAPGPIAPAVPKWLLKDHTGESNCEVGSGKLTLASAVQCGIWEQVPGLSS